MCGWSTVQRVLLWNDYDVADPWHFGADPHVDPDSRIHASDYGSGSGFGSGSGSGSGSFYFHWPSRCQLKTNLKKVFLHITFWRYFNIILKGKKSKRSHKTVEINTRFFLLFLLKDRRIRIRIQIHIAALTNGSGSGSRRPKNTWIRIRIRIRNTVIIRLFKYMIDVLFPCVRRGGAPRCPTLGPTPHRHLNCIPLQYILPGIHPWWNF